ncbi:unnamed protein product [Mytilus coruscus]|uniref:Uncharacterized protein n=1 Tax=Mytilus coruscus TaxID=42192 RepID=A0A6J7ZZ83_MYTCO|nr:unnamed protein product [Mytilus coruscus]
MQQHLPKNRKNGNNQSTDQIQQKKRCMPVVVPEIYSTDACGVTGAMAILNEESTIRNQLDDKAPPIEQHSPIATKTALAAPISNIRNKTDISSSQSDKELRQKENKLRKMEEELKKEKVIINDAIKDQSHLKSYSLNLEAKVKELENSNRILRMKIVGTQPLDTYASILARFTTIGANSSTLPTGHSNYKYHHMYGIYHLQIISTDNKQLILQTSSTPTHQNLQGANLQYGQESNKNIDSSTQSKLDHSTPSSHIMNQEISIKTKPYTEKKSSKPR